MARINRKSGQSTMEYALLIMALVAALIAMAVTVRFHIQGRFKQSADVFGRGEQYEPGVTECYDKDGNKIAC